MYIKRNPFATVEEAADWFSSYLDSLQKRPPCVERTRITQSIYEDMERGYPPDPQGIKNADWPPDVFSLLYADSSHVTEKETIRLADDFIRLTLIKALTAHPDYPWLKRQCTGKGLPAYFAAQEFCRYISPDRDMPERLKKWTDILKLLEGQVDHLIQAVLQESHGTKRLAMIVRMRKKSRQAEDIQQKIQREMAAAVSHIPVDAAVEKALQAAADMQSLLTAWGSGRGDNIPLNQETIQQAARLPMLQEVSRLLGKYRELLLQKRASGYRFGTGEKYDVWAGKNIEHCLPSELGALALPETQILFWDRYRRGRLAQFRLRDKVKKGEGDVIVALDESGSMTAHAVWAKALFLALLDITAEQRRKLALIHFGSEDEIRIDHFLPGKYTRQDKLNAVLHFWNGGTDFVRPLTEAMQLLTEGGFKEADILFITDGICSVPTDFAQDFQNFKKRYRVTLTSILLDLPDSCSPSFRTLCDKVYQSPQTDADQIAVEILAGKSM